MPVNVTTETLFYSYSARPAGVTSATSLRKKDAPGIRKPRRVRNYVGIVA